MKYAIFFIFLLVNPLSHITSAPQPPEEKKDWFLEPIPYNPNWDNNDDGINDKLFNPLNISNNQVPDISTNFSILTWKIKIFGKEVKKVDFNSILEGILNTIAELVIDYSIVVLVNLLAVYGNILWASFTKTVMNYYKGNTLQIALGHITIGLAFAFLIVSLYVLTKVIQLILPVI